MYYGYSASGLEKMYVKGSLKNQDGGFVLQIKNLVDSGELAGVAKLTVDGVEKPLEGVTIELGGKTRPVTGINWSAPLYVYYGATLTLFAPGMLEPGEHSVSLTVSAQELGQLTITFKDTLS
jgi:hypothetical protein